MIERKLWKVGELAKETGITVRTLHHYDQIGLLSPSQHSESGHRLYAETDITRLQQIMSLKQLGFALDKVKELMANPNFNPIQVIELHLESLEEHIRLEREMYSRLEGIYHMLRRRQDVKTDEFIKLIEVMNMDVNAYFTKEQLEKLNKRAELLGQEAIKDAENEWPGLIAKVRTELEKGTPPESPVVVELAKRWQELVGMFTGGDPEITQSAERLYRENPDQATQFGIDKELWLYVKKAMAKVNA
ncbi:HTH-type transcriptional activator TipA [Peptococcaceae bacterium CEB3]|nr:HTH-type transcriptional activator TipA [Peptococcaceae bacterium CEB3]